MPIKPKRVYFTPHTPDDDGVCAAQTKGASGALSLNGADVSGGVASFAASGEYAKVGYQIGVTSTGNLSGVNFTIVGTGPDGKALSETIAGPNNGVTETSGYFRTVTSATVDAAVGTNVKLGTVDEFSTQPIPLDMYCNQTTLAADISGTISYTVQGCYERVTAGQTPNWGDAIPATTADASAILSGSYGAVRIVGNSFTGGATIGLNINQPRYY